MELKEVKEFLDNEKENEEVKTFLQELKESKKISVKRLINFWRQRKVRKC